MRASLVVNCYSALGAAVTPVPPGLDVALQRRPVTHPVRQVAAAGAQFDLGHVQPGAVLGRVVEIASRSARAFGLPCLIWPPEPPRVSRRPFCLSSCRGDIGHSSWVVAASASAGGMFPMGSRRRRLLNQSTHSRVANRGLAQDLVRLAQVTVLALERLDALARVRRWTRPHALVKLGLPHPVTQRLARAADLLGKRADRRPLPGVLALVVPDHPNRAGTDLGGIQGELASSWLHPLKSWSLQGNPGRFSPRANRPIANMARDHKTGR